MSISPTESERLSPFFLPKCIDFSSRKFELTDASKQLYAIGKPGQTYTLIVELPTLDSDENIKFHLIPSFNKDDGVLQEDRAGGKFTILIQDKPVDRFLVSDVGRGAIGSSLHADAAVMLRLGRKAREGLLIGGGVVKSGCLVRIKPGEHSEVKIYIPDEYCLAQINGNWKLTYTYLSDKKPGSIQIKEIDISEVPNLKQLIEEFEQNKTGDLDSEKRKIEESILMFHQSLAEKQDVLFKWFMNRSTALNSQILGPGKDYAGSIAFPDG